VVAGAELVDARPDFFNDAGRFVTKDRRRYQFIGAVYIVQITMADTTRHDANQDLVL